MTMKIDKMTEFSKKSLHDLTDEEILEKLMEKYKGKIKKNESKS